jgi:hypothetical protein
MTTLPFRRPPIPRFKSVIEALLAVSSDRLSNVTYTATDVHVFSAFGTGTFSRREWLAFGGPDLALREGEKGNDVA